MNYLKENELNLNFYDIAMEVHKDRTRDESIVMHSLSKSIETEFAMFSVWCRAMGKEPNEKNFKQYLKEEKVNLQFYVKMGIYEKFFGYKFEYSNEKGRWISKKTAE